MKRIMAFLRRLKDAWKYKDSMVYDRESSLLAYLLRYQKFSLRCRFGKTIKLDGLDHATAILVSYKREHNIEPLIRACLRCTWIQQVVVLNNNPAIHIADWVNLKDPRIMLIDEGKNKGAMERYVYAARNEGQYFLSLDDDIFLTPEQLTKLFLALLENPSVPHGMFGQLWLGENSTAPEKSFQNCIIETDGNVDILNRVYFFTKAQAVECMRLATISGYTTDEALTALSAVDDIFLAFSGLLKPECHNVGKFIDCPTQGKPGIAQWMAKDFASKRISLFVALKKIKSWTR